MYSHRRYHVMLFLAKNAHWSPQRIFNESRRVIIKKIPRGPSRIVLVYPRWKSFKIKASFFKKKRKKNKYIIPAYLSSLEDLQKEKTHSIKIPLKEFYKVRTNFHKLNWFLGEFSL